MIPELPIFSDLFWLFFMLTTSILMLWIAISVRWMNTGASRALLISAALDLPCSLFNSFYWNVWPYGFAGAMTADTNDPFENIEPITSSLSNLLFMSWMVALLIVAFRWRKEQSRVRELQQILEQKIRSGNAAASTPSPDR